MRFSVKEIALIETNRDKKKIPVVIKNFIEAVQPN